MVKVKEKKCKGSGKAIGYGCGKMTFHRVYGLGKMCCYTDWLLNSEQGKIKLAKATLKAVSPRKSMEEAVRVDVERKRLPVVLKQTQIVFNAYIRERDKYKPCISSGFPLGTPYDAGHCFSVKQFSGLRFHEFNVHAQSIGDNRFKEGNFEFYILNVENRIGSEEMQELKELANNEKINPKHWTITEVLEIKKEYQYKLKQLKL